MGLLNRSNRTVARWLEAKNKEFYYIMTEAYEKAKRYKECECYLLDAISVIYHSIDMAQSYGNEKAVGNANRKCGVPCEGLDSCYRRIELLF